MHKVRYMLMDSYVETYYNAKRFWQKNLIRNTVLILDTCMPHKIIYVIRHGLNDSTINPFFKGVLG